MPSPLSCRILPIGIFLRLGIMQKDSYFFLNPNAHELMQNLLPVSVGPSSNTCPRCPWHFLHTTSVRIMPWEKSFLNSIFSVFIGLSKLGHPVPESNFVSEENNSAPHPAQT